MMELNRISSHLVCIATGGMEIGALTVMTIGFRERELVLDLFELITGLRMNHAYVRPGGVALDLPADGIAKVREFHGVMSKAHQGLRGPVQRERHLQGATCRAVGYLDLAGCMALGITGPILRSTGLPWDLRKTQPYLGYDEFEFDVATWDTCDCLRPVPDSARRDGPVVAHRRSGGRPARRPRPWAQSWWKTAKLRGRRSSTSARDGQGNSREHINHIMNESMEALIHHFKLVTEGFAGSGRTGLHRSRVATGRTRRA